MPFLRTQPASLLSRLSRRTPLRSSVSFPRAQQHLRTPCPQRASLCTSTTSTLHARPTHPASRVSLFPRQTRGLATSSGKSEADLIVEELQELYDTAKDEFEIATDSTDSATIYAASDRESARDALNQLVATYTLYTGPSQSGKGSGSGSSGDEESGNTPFVETQFDPAEVKPEVREEVRKRVSQRVRELKNAVEVLEDRASHE